MTYPAYKGIWACFREDGKRLTGRRPKISQFCDYLNGLVESLPRGVSPGSAFRALNLGLPEVTHYCLSHRLLSLSPEQFDALADVEQDVRLAEIKYPIPIIEVCTEDASFLIFDERAVSMESLAKTPARCFLAIEGDDVNARLFVQYRCLGELRSFWLNLAQDRPWESIGGASHPDPMMVRIAKVATNLMIYFHLDGAILPGGKAHGRPALGAIPPTMMALPMERVAHFRAAHYRTLRHAKYYRGGSYPPEKWRIVTVRTCPVRGRTAIEEHKPTELLDRSLPLLGA